MAIINVSNASIDFLLCLEVILNFFPRSIIWKVLDQDQSALFRRRHKIPSQTRKPARHNSIHHHGESLETPTIHFRNAGFVSARISRMAVRSSRLK